MTTQNTNSHRRFTRAGLLAACGVAAVALLGAAGLAEATTQATQVRQSADDPTVAAIVVDNPYQFSTLTRALKAAELVEVLESEGPFTVFAPNNDAFAKIDKNALAATIKDTDRLSQILTFHVVPGRISAADLAGRRFVDTVNGNRLTVSTDGGLRVNDSGFIATDIEAGNGIIHVIDTVLLPTKQDIVQTADAAGSFNTLIAAAKAAGLAGYLQSDGPLTVFAPTDEAFARLGDETIAALLRPENKETLATVLKYHVARGRTYSNSLLGGASIETLAGERVEAEVAGGTLRLNGSTSVAAADLGATNGVIHVIDSVLIPASLAESLSNLNNPLLNTDSPVVAVLAGAIDEGAPRFNDNQPDECRAVYAAAARQLLSYPVFKLSDQERTLLADAAERAGHESNRDACWTLRGAFDTILSARVKGGAGMTTAQTDKH